MARVLVVGGGAREHALVWRLSSSPHVGAIYCAPGNPGIAALVPCVPVSDVQGLAALAAQLAIDLVVVGPEAPLAAGLVDLLAAQGVAAVGPTRAAAMLESSKIFAKELMVEAGIPTASHRVFTTPGEAEAYVRHVPLPVVVKADGLAAGKGVVVCNTKAEAEAAIDAMMRRHVYGAAGDRILIEECLVGEEVSVLALTDGRTVRPLLPAQDHKRLLDDDKGPNTGGMGAVAPTPVLDEAEVATACRTALEPVVAMMAARGTPYRGVLYAGLMRTAAGLSVLEYNCRFGDPEAQVLLPLLRSDPYEALAACTDDSLDGVTLCWHGGAAAGVVLAARGYPEAPQMGSEIVENGPERPGVLIFHAGTARDGSGRLVTAGGRVITVVARGDTIAAALARCLPPPVTFAGMQYRQDIGLHHRAGVGSTL